jgi:hypothetical protein
MSFQKRSALADQKKSIDMKKSKEANKLIIDSIKSIKRSKTIFAEVRLVIADESNSYPTIYEQKQID